MERILQDRHRYGLQRSELSIDGRVVELDDRPVAFFSSRVSDESPLEPSGCGPVIIASAVTRRGTVYDFGVDGEIIRAKSLHPPYPAQCGLLSDVPVSIEGPVLSVGGRVPEVTGPFLEVAFFRGVILVVLESSPPDVVETVFGIDEAGSLVWRIQPPEHPERFGGLSTYVGVGFSGAHVTVNDFWGREFVLDPTSGRVVSGVIAVQK